MSWLDKVERKVQIIAIPNLMLLIVAGMGTVFIFDFFLPVSNWLELSRSMLFSGQVWRLISFIFVPMESSILFIIFTLYFYYMIGGALEQQWGTARFNIYYFVGILCAIASALITGHASNTYLNLSMFFAFAMLNPEFQISLFFLIPIKMKYLAFFNACIYAISFIFGNASERVAIIFSLVNLFLFFGGDYIQRFRHKWKFREQRKYYK